MLQQVMTISNLRLYTVMAPVILLSPRTVCTPEHPPGRHLWRSLHRFTEDKSTRSTGVNEHFTENGELKGAYENTLLRKTIPVTKIWIHHWEVLIFTMTLQFLNAQCEYPSNIALHFMSFPVYLCLFILFIFCNW